MGIFFVTIGFILILLSFVTEGWKNNTLQSIGVGQVAAGIFMYIIYYFENKKQYLTFKNGVLIKHTLFPKKIKLTEIISIKEFAGDIKLITEKEEFVIDTQIVDPNSLLVLKDELKNYTLN